MNFIQTYLYLTQIYKIGKKKIKNKNCINFESCGGIVTIFTTLYKNVEMSCGRQ